MARLSCCWGNRGCPYTYLSKTYPLIKFAKGGTVSEKRSEGILARNFQGDTNGGCMHEC